MARFKHTDNSQGQFMVVNLKEQLLLGSFEWTIDYLINKVDMSLFEQNYKNDELGAAAYSPKVLLKIILYCYSKGIISSRRMEKACRENIVVKALAEDFQPDHDTISRFISSNTETVKDLFIQVLMQCAELDLVTGEMFAVDGCKLPSNASQQWSGKISDLKKKKTGLEKQLVKIALEHQELDKDEKAKKKQECFRKTLGDDQERRERHIKRLERKLKKLEGFLQQAQAKPGSCGREVQTNISDPESAKIKSSHGYIQGYNGIAIADSGSQVIIAGKVIGSGCERGCFPEMLDRLEENMKKITGKKKPLKKSLVLADTGYFSEDNLQEAAKRKIQVLIPDTKFRKRVCGFEETDVKKYFGIEDFRYNKKEDSYMCPAGQTLVYKCALQFKASGTRCKQYRMKKSVCSVCQKKGQCINPKSGKGGFRVLLIAQKRYKENLSSKMRDKIDEPAYRELYSRRIQIIEPVFANMSYCKGMNRFTYRGQKKVNTQWLLYNIVHNIWKCMKPLAEKYGA